MNEGWLDDEYLSIFSREETVAMSSVYGVDRALPGYSVVGLRTWNDFIVQDADGQWFTVPTVPLDGRYMKPFGPPTSKPLQPDGRYTGKIKWYVTPLIFGGDANAQENVIWVSHEKHGELVAWWNAKYQEIKGRNDV